ncbi:MAG: hypothetical protein WC564_01205 [Patescibacteria group bacterium]
MSTTTILSNFSRELAEKNLATLLKEGKENVSSLELSSDSQEQLAADISELIDAYQGGDESFQFFFDMISKAYLQCGSYYSLVVDSAVGEDNHVQEIEALTNFYKLPQMDGGSFTKGALIELFAKISEADIDMVAAILSKEYEYELDEAREEIVNTLKYLRPLVKALKDNPNSLLVIAHDYDFPNVSPEEVNSLIINRAKELENDSNFLELMK